MVTLSSGSSLHCLMSPTPGPLELLKHRRLEKSVLQAACKMCGSVGMLHVPRPESANTHKTLLSDSDLYLLCGLGLGSQGCCLWSQKLF